METQTLPCAESKCGKTATHGIKICIPAIGEPIDQHAPFTCCLGMNLCHQCAREFPVVDFLKGNDQMREMFDNANRPSGKLLDYDRAWVSPIAFGSREWQLFIRRQ